MARELTNVTEFAPWCRLITYDDLWRASVELMSKLERKHTPVSGVVGIPRSGGLVSLAISTTYSLPHGLFDNGTVYWTKHGWRVMSRQPDLSEKILLVDDTLWGGTAMRRAIDTARAAGIDILHWTYGVAFSRLRSVNAGMPLEYGVLLPEPHWLAWNLGASLVTSNDAGYPFNIITGWGRALWSVKAMDYIRAVPRGNIYVWAPSRDHFNSTHLAYGAKVLASEDISKLLSTYSDISMIYSFGEFDPRDLDVDHAVTVLDMQRNECWSNNLSCLDHLRGLSRLLTKHERSFYQTVGKFNLVQSHVQPQASLAEV